MADPTEEDTLAAVATALRNAVEHDITSVSARVDAHTAWREARSTAFRRGHLIRRPVLAAAGVAATIAVVAALAVTVPDRNRSRGTSGVQPVSAEVLPAPVSAAPTTIQGELTTIPNTSGITGVVEYATTVSNDTNLADNCLPVGVICHLHVAGPVRYAVTPPVGGPHNPEWMNCGVYDRPVPNERAVHDLEHGAVWITYRPGLPVAQVQQLLALFRAQSDARLQGHDLGSKYVDLSPWASDALPAPIVISSWGAQLAVDSPTDPRLQQFIDAFRVDPSQTYEAGAACSGQPDGGTPLMS